jgi:NAD(P)-dependent dehydrogenase (short-subunit alcohol dehydrogenase family)
MGLRKQIAHRLIYLSKETCTQMRGKNIVLVGGNSGIGKAVAAQLQENGATIFSYSRTGEGTAAVDFSTDFEELPGLPDVIDGVVYCPGTINLKPFHRISIADFKQEMEVNFYGAIRLLQACLKGLKKSSSPSVVLYSTVAVQTGMGFHAGIASAKGAVEGLTRSLAAEWAPNKIRVNAIAPSLTETPLASALLATPEKKEASDKRHPLGRVGRPEDIAEATVFLLSEKSSWMTGQILHLDGGMSHLK